MLGNQYNWFSQGLGFGSAAYLTSPDANRSYVYMHPGGQPLRRFSTAWGPHVNFTLDSKQGAVPSQATAGPQVPIPVVTSNGGSGAIVWELQVRTVPALTSCNDAAPESCRTQVHAVHAVRAPM